MILFSAFLVLGLPPALQAGGNRPTTLPPGPSRIQAPKPPRPYTVNFPEGSSAEFQAAYRKAAEQLAAGDYKEAARLAASLPSTSVKLGWKVKGVSESQQEALEEGRELAIEGLKVLVRQLKVQIVIEGDVQVVVDPNSTAPVVEKIGSSRRVEVTLTPRRGPDRQPIGKNEAYIATMRAVGHYLGIAETPAIGSVMHRTTALFPEPYGFQQGDVRIVQNNLSLVETLRGAIRDRRPLNVGVPVLASPPGSTNLGDVGENIQVKFPVTISNQGTAPLLFFMKPDCTCFLQLPSGSVKPGETVTQDVVITTRDLTGPISRRLLLVTNDPTNTYREVPVAFRVRPRVRLFRPEGSVLTVPDGGAVTDLYLVVAEGETWKPKSFEVLGAPATVTVEPWTGVIADPVMQEGPTRHSGWRYRVKIGDNLPPGRSAISIEVSSTDRMKPLVRGSIYVQKGILALPDNLYLGDMTGASQASITISRPGQPVTLKGVRLSHPNFIASYRKLPDGDWVVTVKYDGKAARGDLAALVEVLTDDPKQPKIEIPLSGYVR